MIDITMRQQITKDQLLDAHIMVFLTTISYSGRGGEKYQRIEIHDGMSCIYLELDEAKQVAHAILEALK